MSISVRSARRAAAGAIGAGGVAVAMLFGAHASAQAAPPDQTAEVADSALAVSTTAPLYLAPDVTNVVATGFQTAPMPDWWHHRWWHPWGWWWWW